MADNIMGVVWNPLRTDRDTLQKALGKARRGGVVRWYSTTESDPGQAAAAQAIADGARSVVVAGGDGTVRAVAEALAGTSIPLGIVPLGTGNLLARNLGLPLNNLRAAFRAACSPATRAVDIGWAELSDGDQPGRHAFLVIAGFGIDSRMIVETDEDLKSKAGWLAYVAALGPAISSTRITDFDLTVDDAEPRQESAHTLMIGNCGTLRAGFTLLPDARPDDGVLDVMMLSADTLPQWLDTLRTVAWNNGLLRFFRRRRKPRDGSATVHLSGRRFVARIEDPVTFQVDGDTLGDITGVTVEVQPGALLVRVPGRRR